MMKGLKSSHKPRFQALFVFRSQIYQRFTNISGEPDLQNQHQTSELVKSPRLIATVQRVSDFVC